VSHVNGRLAVVLMSTIFLLTLFAMAPPAPGGEVKVSILQVPPKVRTAILEEVGDGRLVDIGEFTDGDRKTWEIEMVADGREYDVLFSREGEVLRTTFEGYQTGESLGAELQAAETATRYQDSFDLENRHFASVGRNRYFILEPGYQLVLEGKEGEHTVTLAVTVLDETRPIGDIETRLVEERESVDGELIEISRNFFAICKETKSVFYFGEEVDEYKDGEVISHKGEWLHGENDARAGLMMPGEPILGAAYYQEVAPGAAMDRAMIVAVDVALRTPAGVFRDCLEIQEENPLDHEREFKTHAPGIGLVQDEDLLLVKYGYVGR
jgi:hypothetical protein